MGDQHQAPLVEAYPPAPGARPSSTFRVTANGNPVFVEAYADISYVRFAFRGEVRLEVEVEGELGAVRLLPAEAATLQWVAPGTLRLTLAEPRPLVAWIGDREKLFILPDPIEPAPVPDGDAVVAVDPRDAGAGGTGLATAAIQAAIDRLGARPGGGTVLLPPGRFVTGTIRLASRVTLHLAAGALLEGSDDPPTIPSTPDASRWGATRRSTPTPASTAGR